MALKKLALGNTSGRAVAAQRIRDEQAFSNHGGTLTGQPHPKPWSDRGSLYLDDREIAIWNQDMGMRSITYVIRSYLTPIAWHRDGRGWFFSTQHHSVSTSRHQTLAQLIVDQCDKSDGGRGEVVIK